MADNSEIRGHSGMLERCDILTGGFPCQDISDAGECAGLEGQRSSLWWEMLRAVCVVRPKYVVVENVAALLDRGMGEVLGSLAEIGYDAEWDCLSACTVGAPHTRERVFIIANAKGERPFSNRMEVRGEPIGRVEQAAEWSTVWLQPEHRNADAVVEEWGPEIQGKTEPCFLRVDDGLPDQMDRLHAIGNAVVPQIAEWIGKRIIEAVAGELGRDPVDTISRDGW